MAKETIRLPPDTIRAIERVISGGGEVKVKLDRGIIKVQEVWVSLVSAQES